MLWMFPEERKLQPQHRYYKYLIGSNHLSEWDSFNDQMNIHMRLFNFAGILFLFISGMIFSCGTSKKTTQTETAQSRKIDSTAQERAPVAPAKKTRPTVNPERTRQAPRPLETK